MSISYDDIGSDVRRIVVSGRLDMNGTDSVAAQLVEMTAVRDRNVVVDLSSVKFVASIGIRALITSAKDVQARGAKMVLVVNPATTVVMSLRATGVDLLIPVFDSVAEAEKSLR